MTFAREDEGGLTIEVQVVPRASRNRIGPVIPSARGARGGGERLKVQLTAPPVEGAANDALRALFSKALGVPRSAIEILRGETGRRKTVRVAGARRDALLTLLGDSP